MEGNRFCVIVGIVRQIHRHRQSSYVLPVGVMKAGTKKMAARFTVGTQVRLQSVRANNSSNQKQQ